MGLINNMVYAALVLCLCCGVLLRVAVKYNIFTPAFAGHPPSSSLLSTRGYSKPGTLPGCSSSGNVGNGSLVLYRSRLCRRTSVSLELYREVFLIPQLESLSPQTFDTKSFRLKTYNTVTESHQYIDVWEASLT